MSVTKTKKTDYIERIQSSEKFTPTIAPVINIDRFKQTKIDQDWAEVYSKFLMFKSIYDSIKTQTFVAENLKIKAIN
ncbi:35441_t:CDS:2, partial [Gigaspora margarita]